MAGKLITLPFRVWIGSARFLVRTAGGVALRAVSLAGQTIGATSPDGSSDTSRWAARDEQPGEPRPAPASPPASRSTAAATAAPPARPEPRPEPVQPIQPPPVEEPVEVSEEPAHVSEEPELVREEAEPGAEDGAGAAVTVMEPWNGYAHMNASEIIERAKQATAAELAAVRLYESRHRSRQTVLAAVDRQLRMGNGSNPA